ncbi:MAG: hypothetical protein ABFD90_15110 [Phycisphaerales bacterium]
MSTAKQFECCECHEPFTYDPTPRVRHRIEEFHRHTTKRPAVVVECPHCRAALYLDLTDGLARPFDQVRHDAAHAGGVFWDLTPAESDETKAQDPRLP